MQLGQEAAGAAGAGLSKIHTTPSSSRTSPAPSNHGTHAESPLHTFAEASAAAAAAPPAGPPTAGTSTAMQPASQPPLPGVLRRMSLDQTYVASQKRTAAATQDASSLYGQAVSSLGSHGGRRSMEGMCGADAVDREVTSNQLAYLRSLLESQAGGTGDPPPSPAHGGSASLR